MGLDPIQGNVLVTGCSSHSSMRFSQCDTAFSGITSFGRRININPISLLYRQLQQAKYKGAHILICMYVCASSALMKIRFTYTFTKRQLSICPIKEEGKNLIENTRLFVLAPCIPCTLLVSFELSSTLFIFKRLTYLVTRSIQGITSPTNPGNTLNNNFCKFRSSRFINKCIFVFFFVFLSVRRK